MARMRMECRNGVVCLAVGGLICLAAGCGDGNTGADAGASMPAAVQAADDSTPVTPASSSRTKPLTASIEGTQAGSLDGTRNANPGAQAKAAFPDDDSTRTLREIQQLRIAPVPTDLAEARTTRRERNERIIELATSVLRATMNEEDRLPQFHQAIGQLMEARFQLALSGTQSDIDAFYADAQALNDRDPKSIAAAEGAYYVARFAHTKAGLVGKKEPVWFETLSRQAREFAERFPQQQQRAVSLLFGAARSCELQASIASDAALATRLMTEAKLCYSALAETFAKSDQGQEATASLRRLALPGQILSQFSGPTADGGFVSADEFPGKPTLIYFWESESEEFADVLLPELNRIREQVSADRLRMIGVALDDEETAMNAFMEDHPVPGQQIYFLDPDQRSWNSPLVRFWGIAECPSVWLLDRDGRVITTSCAVSALNGELSRLVR